MTKPYANKEITRQKYPVCSNKNLTNKCWKVCICVTLNFEVESGLNGLLSCSRRSVMCFLYSSILWCRFSIIHALSCSFSSSLRCSSSLLSGAFDIFSKISKLCRILSLSSSVWSARALKKQLKNETFWELVKQMQRHAFIISYFPGSIQTHRIIYI